MTRRTAVIFLAMSMVFVIALIMRVFPAQYGWYLNEFDPYYDYYASQHVVTLAQQHGLFYALFNNPANCPASLLTACHTQQGYFYWHDIQTWWPYGRNVAATSQVGLQLTGAFLYLFVNSVLRIPISYYDFLVFLPVLFGTLTTITLYFLVKKITGNSAGGIFAALIFAVSPPILERGNLGWFKSEPYSLLLSITGSYFFLTMYEAKNSMRGVLVRALIAGILFGLSVISWGGGDEYDIVFALIFLVVPFVRQIDIRRTVYGGSIVAGLTLLIAAATPRPGPGIVTNEIGVGLLIAWLFCVLAYFVRNYGDPNLYFRNILKILLALVFIGLLTMAFGLLGSVSGRYLTVIDSTYRQTNPLVQSVAEQAVPTGSQFFQDYALLILLGGFGAYIAFRRKNIDALFALILGVTGVYIASSFSRLMVYSTLALGILAAIGLVELSEALLRPTVTAVARKKTRIYEARSEVKVTFTVLMILLISIPMFFPAVFNSSQAYQLQSSGWFQSANVPVSISNGGTAFQSTSQDWLQALQWIRQSPTNSTFVSWWDYGYWIAVMGNRTSLADNATMNETQIALIGRALVSSPAETMVILKQLHDPTYILIFIAGERVVQQQGGGASYLLTVGSAGGFSPAGGDESKKQWFIRIGNTTCGCLVETGNAPNALMESDDFTPTPYFWTNTTLGQLMPFTEVSGGQFVNAAFQSPSAGSGYAATCQTVSGNNTVCGIDAGYTEVYNYQMKYPANNSSAPFELAFESSSLSGPQTQTGLYSAVLIYKINYNAKV
jgi:dolichyl-diphosphooligosaccharide--protein glycosyltransferase